MFPLNADRVRFVLVEPGHAGNIGAAARALKVMGFARLAVVAPRQADFRAHPEALAFAVGAADVLAAAQDFAALADALRGVTTAYAMTGYPREFGPPIVDVREAAARAQAEVARGATQVAFVFGTERTGLSNEDVERCQACCAIPADPAFASLNLAQAVQVCAYELRRACAAECVAAERFAAEAPAPLEQVEGMHAHLEQALIALGYLDPGQPGRLMARLRRLLNRARPTATEIDILRGIAAAILRRKSDRAGSRTGAKTDGR